jgi:4'-phosphopantetheinyl transferase
MTGRDGTTVEARVWQIDLRASERRCREMLRLLSPAEKERARSYRVGEERDRYTIPHGAARVLLGSFLGLSPEEVPAERDIRGKPVLKIRAPAHPARLSRASRISS